MILEQILYMYTVIASRTCTVVFVSDVARVQLDGLAVMLQCCVKVLLLVRRVSQLLLCLSLRWKEIS